MVAYTVVLLLLRLSPTKQTQPFVHAERMYITAWRDGWGWTFLRGSF